MPLSMAPEGKENVICKIGGKEETRLFLERLGFVVGAIVTVISEIQGNLIVNVKDSRVATWPVKSWFPKRNNVHLHIICQVVERGLI